MLHRLNLPVVVAALVVGALVHWGLASSQELSALEKEIAGFVALAIAIFVRAQKKEAGDDARGHKPSAAAHEGGGTLGQDDSTDSSILDLKRSLLARWAHNGVEIDDAAEARAELAAIEVYERGTRRAPTLQGPPHEERDT